MISKHSAHSTLLPIGFRTWLWRYTCLLLLISMLWHRQAIFESKGDKLSSSAEGRIRTQGLRYLFTSRLNACGQTDWAIEDQAKNLNSTARPYDQQAFSPLDLTANWLSHRRIAHIRTVRAPRAKHAYTSLSGFADENPTRGRYTNKNISTLLSLGEENSAGSPSQRTSNIGFDASFVVGLNKLLDTHSKCRWFETSWCPCDITVILKRTVKSLI